MAVATTRQKVSAFLALYLIWGSTYLAIKFAIETMPPFLMAGVRFIVGGTVVYLVLRLLGAARPQRRHWFESTIIGVLLLTLGNGGVVFAEKYVPTGIVSLLVAMVPVYTAVLQHLGKDMPDGKTLLGLILGSAGTIVLIGPGAFSGHASINWLGVIAVTIACLSWAAGSIYSKQAKLHSSVMLAVAMQMICGGIGLSAVSFALGEWRQVNLSSISVQSLAALGYLIVFGSIIAFSAYAWLLKHVSPSMVSTYAYVNPIVAVFLGWACAGEKLSVQVAYAAGFIVAAVWLITSGGSPKRQVLEATGSEPVFLGRQTDRRAEALAERS